MADNISTESGGTVFLIGGNASGGESARDTGRSDTIPSSASGQPSQGTVFLTPDDSPKRGRRATKANVAGAAEGAADMLAGVVETMGRMRYGQAGAMSTTEKQMIREGAKSSLASLPPDVSKRISEISGPVMCCMGLMMYASRMAANESYRRANLADTQRSAAVQQAEQVMREHSQPPTQPPPVPTPPTNGAATRQDFTAPSGPPAKDTLFDLMQ